jgi:GntR family histidine utilization transcriptional repressor
MTRQSWNNIKEKVMEKLNSRHWLPGEKLPNEEIMARDYGVARTTLNRALREIAKEGYLIRRRKAGTFVAVHPVRRAVVKIPIIRHEVEASRKAYGYKLLEQDIKMPPHKTGTQPCLFIRAVHYADDTPHALEERWVNHHIVPDILDANLDKVSANEWLVLNTPFSSGLVGFSAANATDEQAKLLGLQANEAVFIVNRDTWQDGDFITNAQIIYTNSYRVESYL